MKLTPTQEKVVEVMKAHDGHLIRLTGGFWTFEGCTIKHTEQNVYGSYDVPEWSCGTETVYALQKKGVVKIENNTCYLQNLPKEE